jgi:hypothetical protein
MEGGEPFEVTACWPAFEDWAKFLRSRGKPARSGLLGARRPKMKNQLGKYWTRVFLGAALQLIFLPVQAQTGICALDCFRELATCMGSTSGCTVTTSCAQGTCRGGLCDDGFPCRREMQGCGRTFLPDLAAGIRRAGLDEGQERALLAKVEQVEKDLVVAVGRAVQSLEAFQKHLAAQAGKGIDEKTALALSDMAKRATVALQGNGVPACVSTVTLTGGGPTTDPAAGKKIKK